MDFFGPCAERRQCAQDDDGGTECQGGEKADIDFAPDSLFSEKCRQRRVFAEGCTGEKFVAHEAERVAEPPPDYGTYEEGEEQACRNPKRLLFERSCRRRRLRIVLFHQHSLIRRAAD